jgi:23S rRNA (cytosine1962-C5)-methyltransferase
MNYKLIDIGDGRKLEQFGEFVLDRPSPPAEEIEKADFEAWKSAQAYYDREGDVGWEDVKSVSESWVMNVLDLKIELKLGQNNQVGIFPEQLQNWEWLEQQAKKVERPVKILNGFAFTGVATLAASNKNPNIEVVHVDSSKASVTQAKKNAELSGYSDMPIRWIADDMIKFLEREVRRGNRYDAFILDPPAFGRGGKDTWKIERDLPKLLELVDQLLSDKPLFVLLSCHAPNITSSDLAYMLEDLKAFKGKRAETFDLDIPCEGNEDLKAGSCARINK